jgi:DeoR/GlpR family transcriptional regulator of sugar metabolism
MGSTRERRECVLAQLYNCGHVMVKDLAAEMSVSEATVRRDLRVLSSKGHLELVYGGAILPRVSDFSFRSKASRNVESKRIIGRLAAELVEDNDRVLVDSGTTSFEMIHHLKHKRGLSIIVNSARLAVELGNNPDLQVILLGGQYRADRMDTVGPLATSTLDQLRGYLTFIGSDGISMDFGPTAVDIESANLYNLAVRNGCEAILLVDHTKFESPSLYKIIGWESISRVITDKEPSAEWVEFLKTREISLIYPDCDI